MHSHTLPNGKIRTHEHPPEGSHEHGWGPEPPWAYFGKGDVEPPKDPNAPPEVKTYTVEEVQKLLAAQAAAFDAPPAPVAPPAIPFVAPTGTPVFVPPSFPAPAVNASPTPEPSVVSPPPLPSPEL